MAMTRSLASVLCCWLLLGSVAGEVGSASGLKIRVAFDKEAYALGLPILMKVTYRNQGGTDWESADPAASDWSLVRYKPLDRKHPFGFMLGKRRVTAVKLPGGQTGHATWVHTPARVVIKRGKSHEFTVDLYSHWQTAFFPREFIAWFVHERQDGKMITSNRATFRLVFAEESVPALLATAINEEKGSGKRKWCLKWLRKFSPGLQLRIAPEGAPEETRGRNARLNQKAAEDFLKYWKAYVGTGKAKEIIEEINRNGGPP